MACDVTPYFHSVLTGLRDASGTSCNLNSNCAGPSPMRRETDIPGFSSRANHLLSNLQLLAGGLTRLRLLVSRRPGFSGRWGKRSEDLSKEPSDAEQFLSDSAFRQEGGLLVQTIGDLLSISMQLWQHLNKSLIEADRISIVESSQRKRHDELVCQLLGDRLKHLREQIQKEVTTRTDRLHIHITALALSLLYKSKLREFKGFRIML
ncbi:unnamed protein product [Protopolystoma xenopodis]|uniref:Uncharacterized protein n=1 Tax=Protopolystoma xenopodis TaxID=117903 RepID=A0A448WA16_9PLAT|nr:unnamed protein product [Protopolystoma xenopodis]